MTFLVRADRIDVSGHALSPAFRHFDTMFWIALRPRHSKKCTTNVEDVYDGWHWRDPKADHYADSLLSTRPRRTERASYGRGPANPNPKSLRTVYRRGSFLRGAHMSNTMRSTTARFVRAALSCQLFPFLPTFPACGEVPVQLLSWGSRFPSFGQPGPGIWGTFTSRPGKGTRMVPAACPRGCGSVPPCSTATAGGV